MHLGRFLTMDPVRGDLANPLSWNAYSYALGNPLRFTDPWGLVDVDGNGGHADGASGDAGTKDEALRSRPTFHALLVVSARDPGQLDSQLEAYRDAQMSLVGLALQTSLRDQTMASILPYSLTPREQLSVHLFERAYDDWFEQPTLGLGEQDGANLWGPIGNALWVVSRGKRGSSCTAWGVGLLTALQPLNGPEARAVETQRWVPIPHTYVTIEVRRGPSWVPVRRFDPFWRVW
jgi:hypothetical protein